MKEVRMTKEAFWGAISFTLFLVFFIFGTVDAAQWSETYGGGGDDYANDVQQTSDGGYIVAARTKSFGAGNYDAWILKLDRQGAIQWQKTYGGSNSDNLHSIRQTSDGGYIAAGWTSSFSANMNAWVLKLDGSGTIQWQKIFADSSESIANAVRQTRDGGFIIGGYAGAALNAWVVKLDAGGNVQWQKTYGGSGVDEISSLQQTSDDGYIFTGYTSSFGAGNVDAFLVKIDASGNVLWQKTYGGPNYDFAYSVQQTAEGGYIVAGSTASFGAGNHDVWVMKLDASGSIVWNKTYGGSADDIANSVQQTSDGGYIVAGQTSSFGKGMADAWVLKLDSAGNVVWEKTYGGTSPDYAYAVQHTADGGYVIAGRTESFGSGGMDAWIMKLDSNGAITLCANIGTSHATITAPSVTATDAAATIQDASTTSQTAAAAVTTPAPTAKGICFYSPGIVALPGPTTAVSFTYPPVVFPLLSTDPGSAKPVAVGDIAGGVVELQIGLVGYVSPVDIYLGITAPALTSEIYLVKSDNSLQPLSAGVLVKWKDNVHVGIMDEELFGVIPVGALPKTTYHLYMVVTPAGSTSAFYFWTTYFVIF